MRHAAVLAQIEVPLEGVQRELVLFDLCLQRRVIVLALATSHDLPVALRGEDVDAERDLGIPRIFFEVERLHLRRIAVDHHRPVELPAEDGLLVAAQIVAPVYRVAGLADGLDGLGVGDARKRLLHALQRLEVPLEHGLQLGLVLRQHRLDDLDDEVLRQVHVAVEVHVRDLRLDHPELRQVPARLALLRPKGRAEDVRLSDRHRRGFAIELARLRQIGLSQIEVGHLEQRRSSFAGGGSEDGRVHQREPAGVEVVADRLDDRMADGEDRPLPRRAEPEMALLLQEADSVLLRLDGISGLSLEHPETRYVQLVADGTARVLCHLPANLDGSLLRRLVRRRKRLFGDVFLGDDALDDAGTVADLEEVKLAAGALAVEPAAQQHLPAILGGDVADVHTMIHADGGYYCQHGRASSTTRVCSQRCFSPPILPVPRPVRCASRAARRHGVACGRARDRSASRTTIWRRRSTRSGTVSTGTSASPGATGAPSPSASCTSICT